ncbi:MAG: hypothetical protein ABSG43_00390 [Solirubrobacteraceae bacterium]|jgi:hypothetical protein
MSVNDVSPRRVRRDEEDELLAVVEAIARARADLDAAIARRNQLIGDLIDDHCRAVDLADILQLSPAAVYDAAKRTRHQQD